MSPTWASKFLREWCTRAGHSRIEPMQKIAETLRKHETLLLNGFESQGLSSGVVEGFNNKAKLTMRKAYEFKDIETLSTALYHQLGNPWSQIETIDSADEAFFRSLGAFSSL